MPFDIDKRTPTYETSDCSFAFFPNNSNGGYDILIDGRDHINVRDWLALRRIKKSMHHHTLKGVV